MNSALKVVACRVSSRSTTSARALTIAVSTYSAANTTPDDSGEIYTYTRGCILFVCRGFGRTETVVATRPTFIETRVDPERSKVRYGVSIWNIEAVDERTRIEFALDFEPDFWVPPLLGPIVVKSYLRKGGVEALDRIETLAQQRGAAPAVEAGAASR